MELFTRGVGYYTEDDVYAAARVFTGWNLNYPADRADTDPLVRASSTARTSTTRARRPSQLPDLRRWQHDDSRAVRGVGGMQDGIDLINALAMHPETARRLATKLYTFFVSETVAPDPALHRRPRERVPAERHGDQAGAAAAVQLAAVSGASRSSSRATHGRLNSSCASMKETGWVGFSVGSTLRRSSTWDSSCFEPPDVAGWDAWPELVLDRRDARAHEFRARRWRRTRSSTSRRAAAGARSTAARRRGLPAHAADAGARYAGLRRAR